MSIKTETKADVELTEQELNKVAGTGIYMNWNGIDGAVTTHEFDKWIELSSFQFGIGK